MFDQLLFSKLVDGSAIIESIIFASYILVCAAGAVIVGVNIALMLSSTENHALALTLFPLTAYLPFSALLYFLSDSGIFETAAVCAVGTLEVMILKSLQKILTRSIAVEMETPRYVRLIMINAVVALAAAGLVFVAFRFIGKPFRVCVVDNRRNRLLSASIALVFLMMFYFLNSTTNITVLFLTMLIAVSLFLIIAGLLGAAVELIRMKCSEKEVSDHIELQRRNYDDLVRKMEAGRAYRHDMRHHLRIIEDLPVRATAASSPVKSGISTFPRSASIITGCSFR